MKVRGARAGGCDKMSYEVSRTDELTWIFGYGSLVWRPAFDHVVTEVGYVRGFARRFWQASTDHRGVPEAPGRVVTLVRDPHARCWGRGYAVAPEQRGAVLARLDTREKGGYERHAVDLELASGAVVPALVYVAGPGNAQYVGPTALEEIAAVVLAARGPSGTNLEYLLELADALRAMGAHDEHVAELARLVRRDR